MCSPRWWPRTTARIPFENLDPVMGVPVVDLRPEALFDKLVRRRRGGYCFEQNGVMAYVLSQLGFGVDVLGGRVVWMNTSGELPAQTHHGACGDGARRRRPLPRRRRVRRPDPVVADPAGDRHGAADPPRAVPAFASASADGYMLETEIRDNWEPLYMFTTGPFPMIDRQVGSWYVSTYPESHFVTGLTAALVTDDARWNLRGRNLAIHRKGDSERIRFDTAAQVRRGADRPVRPRPRPASVTSRRGSTRCWTADDDVPRIVGRQRHAAQPPRVVRGAAEVVDPASCPHGGQPQLVLDASRRSRRAAGVRWW